jgi:hypothetical protein
MIVTKAIAAILMMGFGSLAAGGAAYVNTHPHALTRAEPLAPLAPKPIEATQIHRIQTLPAEFGVVTIEPVIVIGRVYRQPKAPRTSSPAVQGPCSQWQDLATGPAGRKVRMLCQH